MIACAVAIWLFVAACWYRAHAYVVRADPGMLPSGGHKAMAVTAFAWPFLIAFGALALLAMFLGALRR